MKNPSSNMAIQGVVQQIGGALGTPIREFTELRVLYDALELGNRLLLAQRILTDEDIDWANLGVQIELFAKKPENNDEHKH